MSEKLNFKNQLNKTVNFSYCPLYNPEGYENIKAITFDGAECDGVKTKVFAFLGIPKNVIRSMPAIVLVHGAGCHPDCEWIKKWVSRGYCAIAVDTTGYFPSKHHTPFCEANKGEWGRTIPDDLKKDGYTVSPDNSGMNDIEKSPCNRWMYHAVSQVILAHNILRGLDFVDNEKIGISGISWGGVITSLTIGFDRRFAFAIPIYGSAFLSSGLSRIDAPFKLPENSEWLAEKYYENINMPILWLCWNDDACFSINSVSQSYELTRSGNKNTCISMKHLMNHSHTNAYNCEEGYWFAEKIVSKGKIPTFDINVDNRVLFLNSSLAQVKVRLFYLTEKMSYINRMKYGIDNNFMKQEWNVVEMSDKVTEYTLPLNAVNYYLEFTLPDGIVLCSRFFEE